MQFSKFCIKLVGTQFRNSVLNVTGCEKNEVGEKRS